MNGDRLRIAVISPVWFPVPPTGYGGIEWVVWLLADGLVAAGHDVTLFASGDSHTKAKLSAVFPVAPSARIGQSLPELQHCLAAYARADEFDVISEHSGLPAAAIGGLIEKPVLHTIHGPLDGEGGEIYEQIAEVAPRLGFISISMNQRKPKPDFPWVANCPNALDFSLYPVHPHRGDCLGRERGPGYPQRTALPHGQGPQACLWQIVVDVPARIVHILFRSFRFMAPQRVEQRDLLDLRSSIFSMSRVDREQS